MHFLEEIIEELTWRCVGGSRYLEGGPSPDELTEGRAVEDLVRGRASRQDSSDPHTITCFKYSSFSNKVFLKKVPQKKKKTVPDTNDWEWK